MTSIKVKKLTKKAILPERETIGSAGADLSADIENPVVIRPHTTVKIPTNLAMELPEGTVGLIAARSGLATKEGLRPANCIGVMDLDYRGNYIVALHNDSNETRIVRPEQKIAQLLIMPCLFPKFMEADTLSITERGEGGFGSTGK